MPNNDVAVFVDFENIYISIRNKYGEQPNFDSIRDKCQEYGRVTIARAYADWYRYPRVTNALYANSIEPMYVPTYYYDREEGRMGRAIKNSVDIHMCIDCMKTLYTHPNIDTYIIITGDRDFIPLINAIRQQGKRAIVLGVADAASSHLAQSADEFIFYSQIVDHLRESEEEKRRPVSRDQDVYPTLVQAVKLARQRGNLATLATLKLLLVEMLGDFDEGKYKDKQGKPFEKFRDFVREAERRGLVQIFSSGSVTEVFLPGEDPLKLSAFAPEPLGEDDLEITPPAPPAKTTPEAPPAPPPAKTRTRRSSKKGKATATAVTPEEPAVVEPEPEPPAPVIEVAPPEPEQEVFEPELETTGAAEDIGEAEWQIFREMMAHFDQPTLFIEIFDSLRALRNKEVLDLSNKQMKELIKESINRKMLVRTTRGAHAYYRLNPDQQAVAAAIKMQAR